MAVRIDTDLQAVYVYEPDGHAVPALNTALSAGGRVRIEAATNIDSLVCGFFGDLTATNYWGLFQIAGGTTVELRGRKSGATTTNGTTFNLAPGEYNGISIEHDNGTLRARLDGVVILTLAFVPDAGTLGDRSFQIGGYGEVTGFIDCTISHWRMWSGLLTEAEWRREHRSTVPARTRGLLHDWPMDAGGTRYDDTVAGQPDMLDNPLVPCGDGTALVLRASIIGTPQFFDLGQTATPGALSVNVPRWASRVAVHVTWSSDSAAVFNVASISGNFCGTFVATENEDNLTTSVGASVFHAEVTINGTGRSLTIALDAGSPLAGANCWVSFIQDTDATPVEAMDTGHAGAGGTVPGTASTATVAPALVLALDARLSTTTGGYASNESGWTSRGTNQTTGAFGYFLCSRLRQIAAGTGTTTATTQDTFASAIVSISFRSAAMATVAPTAALPVEGNVTESGNNTAGTPWAVACPALATGDMLLVHLGWDDSTDVTSITPPAGPNGEAATLVAGPIASNGTEARAGAWRYVATGAWSAANRNFTPSASEQWTAAVLKIPAGEFDASTPIGAAATRASAGTAETAVLSPAYSVGSTDGGGRLVTWMVADDDPFTGFAQPWSTHSNVDRGAVAGLLASRDIETTNSEAVTAGTWNIAGDSWASLAYVIRKPSTTTNGTANGVTVSAAASLVAGSANGQRNAMASGVTLPVAASLAAGAATGVRSPTAAGQTMPVAASIIAGSASAVQSPTAAGQTLAVAASLIAGTASSGANATAAGVTLSAAASVVPGAADGTRSGTGAGAALTVGASLLPGPASAVRSPTQVGATLPVAASLVPGSASASTSGTATGKTLNVAASIIPGSASASSGSVAPGALLTAAAGLLPGAASAAQNGTAFGAFLELLTTFVPGTAVTLSSEPSLYVAYVPAAMVKAAVPAGAFTAYVAADEVGAEVPPGDHTATV